MVDGPRLGGGGKLADKPQVKVAALPLSSPFKLPAPQSWGFKQNPEMTGDLLFDDRWLENITGCRTGTTLP